MGVVHEFETQKPWWARWSRRKVLLALILTPVVFFGAPLLLMVVWHWIQSGPEVPDVAAHPPQATAAAPAAVSAAATKAAPGTARAPATTPASASTPATSAQPATQDSTPLSIPWDAQVMPLGDGRALVFGGRDHARYLADTFALDLGTLALTRVSDLAVRRDMHRALRLADGDVLALGGVSSSDVQPAQSRQFMPAEQWDPRQRRWIPAPGLDIAERDFEKPVAVLMDGRVLGFEGLERPRAPADFVSTELLRPWVWDPRTHLKAYLPPPPSDREKFSIVPLDASHVALVGGNTPRDVVALERKCATCRDEYVPFGDAVPSTSTDIFDLATGKWSAGPPASQAGGVAMRLRDGRVFKLSVVSVIDGPAPQTDLLAEIADEGFTKWTRAGRLRVDAVLMGEAARMIETHDGVALFLGMADAFFWSAGKIARWPLKKSWSGVWDIGDDRRALMNTLVSDQYGNQVSLAELVELP